MKKTLVPIALAFALVAVAPVAFAQTKTSNLSVTTTVVKNCTIATNAVPFTTYDPTASGNLDAAGSVVVSCTKATPNVWIGLSDGANGTRNMALGTDKIAYELYSDGTRSTRWGNTAVTGVAQGFASSKAAQTIPVFGRTVLGQDVAAGNYSDTVVATINF